MEENKTINLDEYRKKRKSKIIKLKKKNKYKNKKKKQKTKSFKEKLGEFFIEYGFIILALMLWYIIVFSYISSVSKIN